jgi:hypothetical protein
MGPLIVTLLGLGIGVCCHLRFRRFWVASLVATLAAAAIWIAGVYLFLALLAPSELGPLLLEPILLTAGNALIAAMLAGVVRALTPAPASR